MRNKTIKTGIVLPRFNKDISINSQSLEDAQVGVSFGSKKSGKRKLCKTNLSPWYLVTLLVILTSCIHDTCQHLTLSAFHFASLSAFASWTSFFANSLDMIHSVLSTVQHFSVLRYVIWEESHCIYYHYMHPHHYTLGVGIYHLCPMHYVKVEK